MEPTNTYHETSIGALIVAVVLSEKLAAAGPRADYIDKQDCPKKNTATTHNFDRALVKIF